MPRVQKRPIARATLGVLVGALAVTWLVLAIAQAADILQANAWHPDTVIPWVLTSWPGTGSGGEVIDGSYGFWSVLWFTHLTEGVGFHRGLWVAQPIVLWLAAAGIAAWVVWRLAGRWAALLCAVLMLCVSSDVLLVVLRPTMHAQTVVAGVVLGAFAVESARERPFGGPRRWAAAGVAAALIGGVHLTDAMLWLVGIAPLLAAGGVGWLVARDRLAVRALRADVAVSIGAIVVWAVATAVMRAAGYHELSPDSTGPIDGVNELWPHVRTLGELVFSLGSGGLELSTQGVARGLLSLACAAAIVAGVLAAPALLLAGLRRRTLEPARLAHLTFWSVTVAALAIAFVLTDLAEQPSVRYLVSLLVAAAVSVPLLLGARHALVPAAVLAASAVVVGGAVVALADREIADEAAPARAMVDAIEQAARETGATTGFGDYYLASNVTWATDGRVISRPVVEYQLPICRFPVAVDTRWYRPTGARRTFVIWRGSEPPPAALGRPVDHRPLPGATMWVYDGDVATRLCR
jgi:hypothetical protein